MEAPMAAAALGAGVADAKLPAAAARRSEAALAAAAAEQCLAKGKTDLLLRFFDSEFFDEWIAVSYLWRTKAEGVRDYLCNRMYTLDEDRVESYLSQIVALAILRPSPALDRLVVDFCSRSVRLACKVSWLLCAYSDEERAVNLEAARALRAKCEEAAMNGKWPLLCMASDSEGAQLPPPEPAAALRKSTFQRTMDLVQRLCEASTNLVKIFPHDDRPAALRQMVSRLSAELESRPGHHGLYFPMGREMAQVLRLVADETVLLTSREKAPFLLLVEVLTAERPAQLAKASSEAACAPASPAVPSKIACEAEYVRLYLTVDQPAEGDEFVRVQLMPSLVAELPRAPPRHAHHRIPSDVGLQDMAASLSSSQNAPASGRRPVARAAPLGGAVQAAGPPGEKWAAKVARLRQLSPHGRSPRWALRPVIVKSGDDCRQELMAVQIISKLQSVFADSGLPLWLRPFEVLITSSHAALIEVITDAPSIHALKSRLPRGTSLRDHFKQRYGQDTQAYRTAQRNFVESMAGYSILSYLFQLKDRHNGNLLLDDDGHIVHIDFSFMLSYSPGGINFESAPFKLTRELLEVMDSDAEGCASDAFNYFKVLCIQGFLAARKHAEPILLLAEMMQGWNVPCFRGGSKVLQQLRKRFHLGSTEEHCVELVLTLIGDSLDAWCTRQYDYYQRVVNGIL